jgi:enamine deaminase RidA (YjgF/YER057c/UK114 family)
VRRIEATPFLGRPTDRVSVLTIRSGWVAGAGCWPPERLRLTWFAADGALGLVVPEPPAAVGAYTGAVRVDRTLFVSGHGPVRDGDYIFRGKLGRDMDVDEGRRAARLVMNLLATVKAHVGDLDRVARVVKLLCFVSSDADFREQPAVADGASNLLVEVFGPERGAHARSAVGMAALPFGIAVEIEGIFEVA